MLVSLLLSWLLSAEPAQQACKHQCGTQPAVAANNDECPQSSCGDGAPQRPGTARVPAAILSFEAAWCQPCRQMRSVVARLKKTGIPVQHIDVDQHPDVARKFQVRYLPAYVAVAGDRELNRSEGVCSFDDLVRLTKSAGPPARPAAPMHALAPGAEESEMLIRASYEFCPEKAQALADFLNEFAPETVELRQTEGRLTVTAAPEIQRAIGQFISLLLKDSGNEVACTSACIETVAHLANSLRACGACMLHHVQHGCPAASAACATGHTAACRHNCSLECTNECEGACTVPYAHVVKTEALDRVYWNPPFPAPFGMSAIAPAGPIHAPPAQPVGAVPPPGLPIPHDLMRPPAIHHVFHTTDKPLTLVLTADRELLQEVDDFIQTKTKERAAKRAQQDGKAPFTFQLGITR